jgi:hypothetical protein
MSMISHILLQDAKLITTETDKHGDQVLVATADVSCRFRYITELDRSANREGLVGADAIIWFEPTENVAEGSIVLVDGLYWRIDRIIKARRMSGSTVEFLKAYVTKHEIVENDDLS